MAENTFTIIQNLDDYCINIEISIIFKKEFLDFFLSLQTYQPQDQWYFDVCVVTDLPATRSVVF